MEQRREGEDVDLPHDDHEDHAVSDVDLRTAQHIPEAHQARADGDGDPHEDEVAEQRQRDVLCLDLFEAGCGHGVTPRCSESTS